MLIHLVECVGQGGTGGDSQFGPVGFVAWIVGSGVEFEEDRRSGDGGGLIDLAVEFSCSSRSTPMDAIERVAIFYSRSLYAPEDLYQTVASDARKMEPYLPFTQSDLDYSSDADYGKTPAMYAPLFQEPWMRGMISIRADSATYDAMLSGSYHDWDRLNEALGVWGGPWRGVGHREVLISFSNRLHPKRVARMYAALPGVTEAGTQPESYYWQECLVHFERGRRTYYHRLGSGICTDTCTSYVWTVIRVDGDGARVLDTWEGDPPEAWADEIAVAKAEYVACTEGWE